MRYCVYTSEKKNHISHIWKCHTVDTFEREIWTECRECHVHKSSEASPVHLRPLQKTKQNKKKQRLKGHTFN